MLRDNNRVAFALSTWRRAKEFNAGVADLAERMPLSLARAYLLGGPKRAEISEGHYDEIDALQEIRRQGLVNEMAHVYAQAYGYFLRDPEGAAELILQERSDCADIEQARLIRDRALAADRDAEAAKAVAGSERLREADGSTDIAAEAPGRCERMTGEACARALIGDSAVEGRDIRLGFGPEVLEAVPSLDVYELFIWMDVSEFPESAPDTAPNDDSQR